MSIVDEIVFKRFTVLYGDPKTSDVESFFSEYQTALRGYSNAVLVEAVNRVVQANEYRSWPMPGEICKACREIGAETARLARQTAIPPRDPIPPPPDPESVARVKALAEKLSADLAVGAALSEKSRWSPDVTRPAMDELQRGSQNRFHRKGELRP